MLNGLLRQLDVPVSYIGAHGVHAGQIRRLFLIEGTLHFLDHDCVGWEVVFIKVVGTAWKSTEYLLSLSVSCEESKVHVFEAENYYSVVMTGWSTQSVDKRIADAHQTVKTYSIR